MILNFYISKSGAYYGFYFGPCNDDPNSGSLEINIDHLFTSYYAVNNRKIIWGNDNVLEIQTKEVKEAAEDYVRSRFLLAFG